MGFWEVGLSLQMQASDQSARYDDSVLNVLRLESDRTPASRISLYRNLIDLMMQNRASTQGSKRTRIFETLGRIHGDVPAKIRHQVAANVGRQRIVQRLDLVSWLWAADPDVTLPMLSTLRLQEADWLKLLPRLPQAALGQLGARDDMTDQVRRALASLGATGLGLPPASEADAGAIFIVPEAAPPSAEEQDAQTVHLLPVGTDVELERPPAETPPELPTPDWSQFSRRLSEQESAHNSERIDFIARAVLGGDKSAYQGISGAASNDDQPVKPAETGNVASAGQPDASQPDLELTDAFLVQDDTIAIDDVRSATPSPELSDDAQQQIRDLIGRIADFRKRWIDKTPVTTVQPDQPDQAAAIAAVADAIQADVRATASDASHSASVPADTADISHEPDESEPLVLMPSIAANIGASVVSLPVQRDAQALADIAASLADFQWESDRSGRFVLAQSAQLSVEHGAGLVPAMSGRAMISLFADKTMRGVVDRALVRRMAFRNAHFTIETGLMQGQWRLSGVPVFHAASGLYQGHRGVAQRLGMAALALIGSEKLASEKIAPARSPDSGQLSTDRLATLAHETRTPLNAIMGFAQLIDGQTWGDVPEHYRTRASAILEESNRLLRALDDVSDQAKLDRGAYTTHVSSFHPADVLVAVQEIFSTEAERRGVHLLTRISDGLPNVWSDKDAIERALGRLLVVALAGAAPQELVLLSARALPNDDVCFAISNPARSAEAAAKNTDGAAEGFGVRLVRQLAGALSGRLDLSDRRFELIIPAIVRLPEPHRERG